MDRICLIYLSYDNTYIRLSQQRCSRMEIIMFNSRDMKGDDNTVSAFLVLILLGYTKIALNLVHRF